VPEESHERVEIPFLWPLKVTSSVGSSEGLCDEKDQRRIEPSEYDTANAEGEEEDEAEEDEGMGEGEGEICETGEVRPGECHIDTYGDGSADDFNQTWMEIKDMGRW
jgi:hypothetical protein